MRSRCGGDLKECEGRSNGVIKMSSVSFFLSKSAHSLKSAALKPSQYLFLFFVLIILLFLEFRTSRFLSLPKCTRIFLTFSFFSFITLIHSRWKVPIGPQPRSSYGTD